jgi:hypothetical protein
MPIGGPTGGGQSGFGSGGSFTGPAKALDIYGDFAAAYSGIVQSSGTPFNLLDFTTGNYLFVGEWTCYYGVTGSGNDIQFKAKMNGATLIQFNLSDSNDLAEWPTPILIPAYTKVEIEQTNENAGADLIGTSIIGRIYRE